MAATLSSDNYQLKWHSFGAHLHMSVATLYQSESYTDTILCTYDGRQIKAHRFVLSLCSVYFQNVFRHHIKSISSLPLIVIMPPDIDYKTLKTLIQYIYCGETTVSNDILENVLKAGDTLKIRGLWRPKNSTDSQSESSTPVTTTTATTPTTTSNSAQARGEIPPAKKIMPTMKKIILPSDKSRMTIPLDQTANNGIRIENIHTENDASATTVQHETIRVKSPEKILNVLPKTVGKTSENGDNNTVKKMETTPSSGVIQTRRISAMSDEKISKETASISVPSTSSENSKHSQSVIKVILKTSNTTSTSNTISTSSTSALMHKQNSNDSSSEPDKPNSNGDDDSEKYFVIKEEPLEWDQLEDVDLSENEMLHTEMTIKPEIIFPNDDDDDESYQMKIEEDKEENYYSPLTCELCSETFTLPAEWVRHIEGHSDLYQPAKRQRRGRCAADEGTSKLPPLICDLCQKLLPTPAEWVRHIQQTHTERELAASNNSSMPKQKPVRPITAGNLKICNICTKRFPSHASMVIHARTHTGERPFLCTFCNKGFNVKSNLLRHLRTLHDKIISSTEVNDKPDSN